MTRDYNLEGKKVLITGGSRGLGRAMALGFAAQGADLAIASRKIDSCLATAREIETLGVKAFPYAVNVSDWDQIEALVKAVYASFGSIDVLINNAGMSPLYASLDGVTEALFDKVIGVNLKGPFRLSALVGARMQAAGQGAIINVSSVAAVQKSPGAEPYGAAKAGLNALTRSFAAAFAPEVRVNCIMAGPFLTDISRAWDMDAFNKQAARTIPLKRGGQAEEVVGAALYFASDISSFTTGAILPIDGGVH